MKIEITGHIHWRKARYQKEEEYQFFQTDMSQYGYVVVCPTTLELEIPDDFDPVKGQVEVLKKERARIHAEFQSRVNEIDDALSKLLCLEFVDGDVS